jgi:hypothetical protein
MCTPDRSLFVGMSNLGSLATMGETIHRHLVRRLRRKENTEWTQALGSNKKIAKRQCQVHMSVQYKRTNETWHELAQHSYLQIEPIQGLSEWLGPNQTLEPDYIPTQYFLCLKEIVNRNPKTNQIVRPVHWANKSSCWTYGPNMPFFNNGPAMFSIA